MLPYILFEKYIYIFTIYLYFWGAGNASPRNHHCASYIGTHTFVPYFSSDSAYGLRVGRGLWDPLEIGFGGKEKAPIEGLGGDKSPQKL